MRRTAALLLGLLALIAGCSKPPAGRAPGPVRVVATLPPLGGLARPLLPAGATLTTIVPPTASEHGYELKSADIAALTEADVVVLVGLGLDAQVESFLAKHPRSMRRVVRFADIAGIAPEPAHEHQDHDEHDHGGSDPHLWLDPDLCRKLIPEIDKAIRAVDPSGRKDAAAELDKKIADFDAESKTRLAPCKDRAIVTHHAAWGRFADHYGLKVAAVLRRVESAEVTNEAQNDVIRVIREQHLSAIFVEPQFSPAAAERIRQVTGVKIGTLDPLGDGDWFKMMRANVESVATSFGK